MQVNPFAAVELIKRPKQTTGVREELADPQPSCCRLINLHAGGGYMRQLRLGRAEKQREEFSSGV